MRARSIPLGVPVRFVAIAWPRAVLLLEPMIRRFPADTSPQTAIHQAAEELLTGELVRPLDEAPAAGSAKLLQRIAEDAIAQLPEWRGSKPPRGFRVVELYLRFERDTDGDLGYEETLDAATEQVAAEMVRRYAPRRRGVA